MRVLHLESLPITDISSLGQLEFLEQLDISNTLVSDISSLAALKNLRSLTITGTKVTDKDIKILEAALPNCSIDK